MPWRRVLVEQHADRPVFANDPAALGPALNGRVPEALEGEIRQIYARSPLYGQRFPLHAEPLQWSCYREIPALSKQEIVQRGHAAFFADYAEIERGLQGQALRIREHVRHHCRADDRHHGGGLVDGADGAGLPGLAILRQFVGRPYRKCVLAPVGCSSNLCPYEDHPFPHRYFDGTVYLNLSSDPFAFPEGEWDRIVLELQATRPEVLEGEPVYLSLLARAARRRGVSVPSLRAVILTYGKASRQHGRRIAEVFPAPQVDLYGSTEAGYLFVGEAFRDDSRVIDANAFIELVPWRPEQPDVFQILVTTRGREAMPLLRYHTGDIVQRLHTGFRVLGRERDLYFRPDGRLVSADDIDAALPEGFRCWHYVLAQTGDARWDFHYVADETAAHGAVEQAIAPLLGEGARINAFRRKTIAPAASGKFALLKPLAD